MFGISKFAAALSFAVLAAMAQAQFAYRYEIPFFLAAGLESGRQSFVRVAAGDEGSEVTLSAIDDDGVAFGPVAFSVASGQAMHFNSEHLEGGGGPLPTGVGDGAGHWRLALESTGPLGVASFSRTRDGQLAHMDGVAEQLVLDDGRYAYWLPVFNPGRNQRSVSWVRISNPSTTNQAELDIHGWDDSGRSRGPAQYSIPPGASRILTASQLEVDAFGEGAGKWRLLVVSPVPLKVLSLMDATASQHRHLTNLTRSYVTASERFTAAPTPLPSTATPFVEPGALERFQVVGGGAERVRAVDVTTAQWMIQLDGCAGGSQNYAVGFQYDGYFAAHPDIDNGGDDIEDVQPVRPYGLRFLADEYDITLRSGSSWTDVVRDLQRKGYPIALDLTAPVYCRSGTERRTERTRLYLVVGAVREVVDGCDLDTNSPMFSDPDTVADYRIEGNCYTFRLSTGLFIQGFYDAPFSDLLRTLNGMSQGGSVASR